MDSDKIMFTYKDFDSLDAYKRAIGRFWADGPLTQERTDEVYKHLGIYKELKGETKESKEERKKRIKNLIDEETNEITKKNMEMIFNL